MEQDQDLNTVNKSQSSSPAASIATDTTSTFTAQSLNIQKSDNLIPNSIQHRSPNRQIDFNKSRDITPQHLLRVISRQSTPEEYVSPTSILSCASSRSITDVTPTKIDYPFSSMRPTNTPPSHIPIYMKHRTQPNSSNSNTPISIQSPGTGAIYKLRRLTSENHDNIDCFHTPLNGVGGMVSTVVDEDDDIIVSAHPRTSIPQPSDPLTSGQQSTFVEGVSGGYYQGQPFDLSTIDAGYEMAAGLDDSNDDKSRSMLGDDHDDVAGQAIKECGSAHNGAGLLNSHSISPLKDIEDAPKSLNSLRKKLESVLTKKIPTPHKSAINTHDIAESIYLEVRETMKDMKEIIRDIKRKQEMAMIETETVKDGLYDLLSARKQLEEVQASMCDVQESIRLAEMEFASHRKTFEERKKEDNELEEEVIKMEQKTLKLAQLIDEKKKEQHELQAQKPPPLLIRISRELNSIRSSFSSFLGMLFLFLMAEIILVYILMLSRWEELELRSGFTNGYGGRDAETYGFWVMPFIKSIVDGAPSFFFSDSRDVTPI